MKNKILLILFVVFIFQIPCVNAEIKEFDINIDGFSIDSNSKQKNVFSNFNKDYNLKYSISEEDTQLEKDIKDITKKATYLLFGDFNNKKESNENYYKRKKEWYNLRYNPNINDKNIGEGEQLVETISGLAIPQLFNQASELGMIYNSYGDIRITNNKEYVISTIVLPNVKIKEQSSNNPMEYEYVETNYILHYYFKKLNNEWKLYYLYGENTDNISKYFNIVEKSESNRLSIVPSYNSELSKIYNFDKLNKLNDDIIKKIYDSNISNVFHLNSYYNNKVISSANGFLIDRGIMVTTWSFIENALINSQYITVNNKGKSYNINGIITANIDSDIAVLKIDDNKLLGVNLGDIKKVKVEDPVVTISNKTGASYTTQKGIILSNSKIIQTSIPLNSSDEGSPLFDIFGNVIGINTSKSTDSSISLAINSAALNEIKEKLVSIDSEKIQTIEFNKLKQKYYYLKKNKEKEINNIPKNKWNSYKKIGDIEKTVKLKLIKSNYVDGIVSLRYKNDISNFINSMQLSYKFREQLIKEGYKKITNNEKKMIYKNNKYQVIIMDEFDYLIIVMVKL